MGWQSYVLIGMMGDDQKIRPGNLEDLTQMMEICRAHNNYMEEEGENKVGETLTKFCTTKMRTKFQPETHPLAYRKFLVCGNGGGRSLTFKWFEDHGVIARPYGQASWDKKMMDGPTHVLDINDEKTWMFPCVSEGWWYPTDAKTKYEEAARNRKLYGLTTFVEGIALEDFDFGVDTQGFKEIYMDEKQFDPNTILYDMPNGSITFRHTVTTQTDPGVFVDEVLEEESKQKGHPCSRRTYTVEPTYDHKVYRSKLKHVGHWSLKDFAEAMMLFRKRLHQRKIYINIDHGACCDIGLQKKGKRVEVYCHWE